MGNAGTRKVTVVFAIDSTSHHCGIVTMKTEKTEMIMKYFDVTYKVAKQYEIILKDKQLRQIKAWYEAKKGDGAISAESEEVLKEILKKGGLLKKVLDNRRR